MPTQIPIPQAFFYCVVNTAIMQSLKLIAFNYDRPQNSHYLTQLSYIPVKPVFQSSYVDTHTKGFSIFGCQVTICNFQKFNLASLPKFFCQE